MEYKYEVNESEHIDTLLLVPNNHVATFEVFYAVLLDFRLLQFREGHFKYSVVFVQIANSELRTVDVLIPCDLVDDVLGCSQLLLLLHHCVLALSLGNSVLAGCSDNSQTRATGTNAGDSSLDDFLPLQPVCLLLDGVGRDDIVFNVF